jgi:hypothetical protein
MSGHAAQTLLGRVEDVVLRGACDPSAHFRLGSIASVSERPLLVQSGRSHSEIADQLFHRRLPRTTD